MSSQYRKIEYESEGAYGSVEKEWLYIHSHDTVDIMNLYDQRGNHLISYSDDGFNMAKAIKVISTDWNDERLITVGWDEWKEVIKKEGEETNVVVREELDLLKKLIDVSYNERIGTRFILVRLKRVIDKMFEKASGKIGMVDDDGFETISSETHISYDKRKRVKLVESWNDLPEGSLGWHHIYGPMGIYTKITLDDIGDDKSIRGANWTYLEKKDE